MKNLFIRILTVFIWNSEKRKNFRAKYLLNGDINVFDKGFNNHCILVKENGTEVETKYIKGLQITFWGNNNLVKIHEPYWFDKSEIQLADESKFIMGQSTFLNEALITEGVIYNSVITIGKNFSSNGMTLVMQEQGCNITIGEDCMFAKNIILRPTDSHTIYDEKTYEIINKREPIYIGNHVWLGKNTTILKGSYIPDNSVVGLGSIYTKSSCKDNTIKGGIYVGISAKLIKSGVNWSRELNRDYIAKTRMVVRESNSSNC